MTLPKLPDKSPEKQAVFDDLSAIVDKVHDLPGKRVEAGDTHALFLQAWVADRSGSQYYGADSIYVRYRCVVRGNELCKQFDLVH